jgi:hypothetical protein
MKFKYNYLENKLWRIEGEYSYEIFEENQFQARFGGQGFVLGEGSWITFTIYEKKIRVFYKKAENEAITYYQRDFSKADLISFEFTEEDQIIKNEKGHW